MTRVEEYLKMQLVEVGWRYGAHYGGHKAIIAIMQTVRNRVRAGWGTFAHVLDTVEKWHAAPPKTTTHPESWDRNFVHALAAVDQIFDGTTQDSVNGATYWGDLTDVQSEFFLQQVCRNPDRQRCSEMSSLAFFK